MRVVKYAEDYRDLNRIQLMRQKVGLSQSKFAGYFNIPTRTLQKWEIEQSKPPEYVVCMMEKILFLEDYIKQVSDDGETVLNNYNNRSITKDEEKSL